MKRRIMDGELKNIEVFSSEKVVGEYSQKTKLFPQESKIIKRYFTKKGAKVLDLGCGTGRTTYHFYEMGFDVIGVDISKAMIAEAKSKYPYIDFRVGDACELNFKDEIFDYVLFSFNGIDYIFPENNRIKAIKEIYRVLKSGGLFIFSTHNSWFLIPEKITGYYFLLKFWFRNLVENRIFSKYKISECQYGELLTYHINPVQQKKQLENCGFELLEIIGRFDDIRKYFEPWLYYVARKR